MIIEVTQTDLGIGVFVDASWPMLRPESGELVGSYWLSAGKHHVTVTEQRVLKWIMALCVSRQWCKSTDAKSWRVILCKSGY